MTRVRKGFPPRPGVRHPDYWTGLPAILSSVRGERRRRRVLEELASNRPELLDDALLSSELPPEFLRLLRAIDPELAAGEYLPPLAVGEVEFARMFVRWPRPTVLSGRVRRAPTFVTYAVVGEDERRFVLPQGAFTAHLAMSEVVDIFCGIREAGESPAGSSWLEQLLLAFRRRGPKGAELAEAVELHSPFYPGLQAALLTRIRSWDSCTTVDSGPL
jgi:hypothetical protein